MGTIADFSEVMELITTHQLIPAVSKTFPLADAGAAHTHLESGQNLGKVILSIID